MSSNSAYRHSSIRPRGYDYAQAGLYFVTVCTHERHLTLGKIVAEEMKLNAWGRAVAECWLGIPDHHRHVELDEFVVMPNHVHGILWIVDVVARHAVPLLNQPAQHRARFGQPIAGSLSTLVRSFKSAAARRINQIRNAPGDPIWQRNYYEHVIRDERSLDRIRNYIQGNPARWETDREKILRRS